MLSIPGEPFMGLTASDVLTYYRPSICERRVYLRERGEQEEPPSAFDETLERLGIRHERSHLETFKEIVDLSVIPLAERIDRTREAVKNGFPLIYQGGLTATFPVSGIEIPVTGVPDFLVRKDHSYLIRDSKISRRITEKDHPEILLQLQLYGLLFERTFGQTPSGLQVHSGTGEIIDIAYDKGQSVLPVLENILNFKKSQAEPYSPVGWTKCGGCPFHIRCVGRAEADHDVALVVGVDQNLARALREIGVHTRIDLLTRFDEKTLSEFKKPWGKSTQRVGTSAAKILLMTRMMEENVEKVLAPPAIPKHSDYVMFDLEGMPPHLDELDKIYLWGMKIFGERPSPFLHATAGFGPEGDRAGWMSFLNIASDVFKNYGDLPFVHWHHYERVRIDMYVDRFGDPDGTAARVRSNLLDLLPVTQKCIALPLPSYSLKVVERYIGFKRTQEEYGGEWAMAKYIEATETDDEIKRAESIDQILKYNEEDLDATWAVLKWLRGLSTPPE